MIYLRLFYEFFKTGLFAFGGGLATIPFLTQISENTGWFTKAELADMIAVSESTPGPIGVNMATYVGFTSAGIPGSIIATLGIVAPCIIVMLIISKMLMQFRDSPIVSSVMTGLRPASIALITAAAVEVMKVSVLKLEIYNAGSSFWSIFDIKAIILAAVIFVLYRKIKGHPIFYIIGAAIVGAVFRFAGA